jgi:hypothetical protein
LVRRYSSDDPLKPTQEELARELIPAYWLSRPASLPATRGMHRWVWDLHYPDPDSTIRGYPISAVPHRTVREPRGPLALPGSYRARLTFDGRTVEQPLEVLPDPRVKSSPPALQAQFDLAAHLAELLGSSSRAVMAAQSEREQLKPLLARQPANKDAADFDQQLAKLQLTDVQGHIDTLYKEVIRGDGAPTAALVAASDEAAGKLAPQLSSWEQLQKQLPELNRKLRNARLPPVRPELAPPRDLNAADED